MGTWNCIFQCNSRRVTTDRRRVLRAVSPPSLNLQKGFPMLLNRIKAALLASVLAFTAIAPSFALTSDPGLTIGTNGDRQRIIPARNCSAAQDVCYLRATVNFNDPTISSGIWAFTLPNAAYILAVDADVTTAFNATSTNTISIGATPTGTDFLAATSVTSAGVQHLTSAAGLGLAATGNTALQLAINGAIPVFFRYVQTGTAATAGQATFVITYAPNNDK
jgi:hypothetical protein